MKTQSINFFLNFLILISTVGCASIVSGKNQTVSVTTVKDNKPLSDSSCKLTNSKGEWFTPAPGSVFIRKSYGDISISCNNKSLTGVQTFKSEYEAMVWGNILFGGLIGFAIDAGGGAGFSYPQSMVVELKE